MEKIKCANQVLCGMHGLDVPSEPLDIDKAIKMLAIPSLRYYEMPFRHPREQIDEEYVLGKG
ncbi:MAG: hypothetical protein CVU99_02485 [Firmicutes bacterium HGW-Firmicutes-4]|jgi:hypothetical protein|nr:MAG: hypothetical protein CVU99_02485 [Firmicutes bacterium HGW-Firmicutes-4]